MRRWQLKDYEKFVGAEVINELNKKAKKLQGKHILHINSTYQGGGVAEILNTLIPLMNNVGINAGWRILHGSPDFFLVTKKFHNALQGGPINLTEIKEGLYVDANEMFSIYTHLDHDCVVVHDPQPLPLINFYRKSQPWIWRCHLDLTEPQASLWEYLKTFINKYDLVIFSNEKYKKPELPGEQKIVYPAIAPFSLKNKELPQEHIARYLRKFKIPIDKPIILQVSRFDPWKDPEGALEVFKYIKEIVDCRLIYCFNLATDDPEGLKIYSRMRQKAKPYLEKKDVMFIRGDNQILVNVLQRVASVVMQKSIREGFCLAVTEALWKGKPVVASNVGGIPLQITNGENGFLVAPRDTKGFGDKIIEILRNPDLAREMGKKAKEVVRKNFLITRLLSDYLDLLPGMIK